MILLRATLGLVIAITCCCPLVLAQERFELVVHHPVMFMPQWQTWGDPQCVESVSKTGRFCRADRRPVTLSRVRIEHSYAGIDRRAPEVRPVEGAPHCVDVTVFARPDHRGTAPNYVCIGFAWARATITLEP